MDFVIGFIVGAVVMFFGKEKLIAGFLSLKDKIAP